MKKLLILNMVILSVMSCSNVTALGFVDAGVINHDMVNDLRLYEIVSRNKSETDITKQKNNVQREQEQVNNTNKAVPTEIKRISFVNNYSIPSDELFSVVSSYINKPMSNENISAVRKTLMKYYQNRGYYSVLVVIVSADMQTGGLVFDIKEGGKNPITIQNNI